MPLELVEAPRTIYVHVLRMDDGDDVRRSIRHLTSLAVRAFGSDADVRALRRDRVRRTRPGDGVITVIYVAAGRGRSAVLLPHAARARRSRRG